MIGEQFGNYRSIALLGEGGMGSVYLAEHPGIGRRVAVKVLHKNYSRDEHLLARFLNEARAANAIRHPNIIEILDSGTLADGTPFLVMELLEGESLGSRLRNGGIMPIATGLDFAYQTASALGAAHAKGIVHRDLKPDNLFIINDPHDTTRERMKVLDFGIAKLQQASTADSVKTRTGTLMGTPIYMSPEQCRGTRSVDHRSDIYSLGVIIYEMLAGETPFVSEGFGELVNMHLNVPPASARAKRPEIPLALDALVLKMLSKNPDDRYASMAEVQGALKTSGGSQFTVRGSSPDLGKTQAPKAATTQKTTPMHDTFGASSGERVGTTQPGMRGGTKLMIGGLAAAVVVAAGVLVLRGGGGEMKTLEGPVAIMKPTPRPEPPPATTTTVAKPTTPTPIPTAPLAPRKVELRLVSVPAGARVLDDADGAVLGTTPLVLTRPLGGSMKVRIEKDGYGPSTRTMVLDGDHTLELTLPQNAPKAKARPRPPRPPRDTSSEPAKL